MVDCACKRYVKWRWPFRDIAYEIHCNRLGVRKLWHAVSVFLPVTSRFDPEAWNKALQEALDA